MSECGRKILQYQARRVADRPFAAGCGVYSQERFEVMASKIVLNEMAWKTLREAVLRHRRGYALTEAAYAAQILDVSINTFKKCVSEPHSDGLSLKEQTLVSLIKVTKVDAGELGIDVEIPGSEPQYGGYDPEQLKEMVGTYFTFRRSFLTARNIVRGFLEIRIDEKKRCLAFEEFNKYVSDAGFDDETNYRGEIYINDTRTLFSLIAFQDGQMRATMTQGVIRAQGEGANPAARGRLRLRGTLLTHGRARGGWQPTVSAVVAESLPQSMWKTARKQTRTILPDDPEFAAAAVEIAYAEEHSCVLTPLMWSRLPPLQQPTRSA